MWVLGWLLLVLGVSHVASQDVSVPSSNLTFAIEHLLTKDNEYKLRTKIQIVTRPDGKQGILYLDKNAVSGEEVSVLKSLVDKQGLYTVRIRIEREGEMGEYITSSIPVCALQKSAFKEDFQVFLNSHGSLIGASYSVPPMTIAHFCDSSKIKDTVQFQTRIRVGDEVKSQSIPSQVAGPLPPYLQNVRLSPEDETTAGQAQQKGQQKTFFQQYWYIILGLLLYTFLSGGNAPPAKGEEGKGQGATGNAAAGAVKQ
jgi:hypothetical protein